MPAIVLTTEIAAPIETVFDLSRSIDLHIDSTSRTNERVIAGRTSGLIELGESVTWEATHFFVRQQLTVRVEQFDRPHHFRDSMVSGAFTRFDHDHSKYHWPTVLVLEELKNDTPERFAGEMKVAHFGMGAGIPAGRSTIYLVRYIDAHPEYGWKLDESGSRAGFTHHTKIVEEAAVDHARLAVLWGSLSHEIHLQCKKGIDDRERLIQTIGDGRFRLRI